MKVEKKRFAQIYTSIHIGSLHTRKICIEIVSSSDIPNTVMKFTSAYLNQHNAEKGQNECQSY